MQLKLDSQVKKLPTSPGIYQFYGSAGELLYVGKAKSLKKRVASYFAGKSLGQKTDQLVTKIAKIDFIKVFSEFEALLLEADLIRKHKPFYNIQARDDKSPIYITISKGPVPTIAVARKTNLTTNKYAYFKGPFPSAAITREILKFTRRIFPYCHHSRATKPCLYVHLGLCPYPHKDAQSKLAYAKNIAKIQRLLNGQSKRLIRDIKNEMTLSAKSQNFELAQICKNQLKNLEFLSSTFHDPRLFLERPTLVDDLTKNRLTDLKRKIGMKKMPRRIECYDISNISGKFATGSMVVFVDGRPEKNEYRKFKIKYKDTPDDYEMLREVLARRFKNSWPDADLVIIDGGQGQLSSALEIAKIYKKEITIVSLAKRLEQIYIPGQEKPISLEKSSPARQLAQSLRDEAHRFAITYHRLLRSKEFITSP